MNYINLFENFDKKYYSEIRDGFRQALVSSRNGFESDILSKKEDLEIISNEEFNEIRSCIYFFYAHNVNAGPVIHNKYDEDGNPVIRYGPKPLQYMNSGGEERYSKILFEIRDNSVRNYIIVKQKDDWFYLYRKYTLRYYKCDQLDGLLQCIKDIIGEL